MPIKPPFKFLPKDMVEWARFFRSSIVEADEVPPDAISDSSITYQKLQNVTPDRLLGRDTSPAGTVQELLVSGGLEFTGTGIQRSALTGDVSASAGSNVTFLRTLVDADIPATIARDTEVTAAIVAHEGAVDPHPTYTTAAELSAAITAHEALADPHPTYTTAAELAAAIAAFSPTSGTYTPTITNVANVAASGAWPSHYIRIGNEVVVSGRVDIDPTATGSATVGISLPIASNLAAATDVTGVCSSSSFTESGAIGTDTVNDRASLVFVAVSAASHDVFFHFMYTVI